jgi:hypothetical protein
MGISIGTEKDYCRAIRDLFPKGEYWDRQFADPESDVSLFCKAKTQEIILIRNRMRDLLLESDYRTAVETIGDWERVLLDCTNANLTLEERHELLSAKKDLTINRIDIANIAQKHGLALVDIVFPFKPSYFGFSQFGRSIFSRPVFFSVFYIVTRFDSDELRSEAKKRIIHLFDNASFGRAHFGTGQFLGRSYFNKENATGAFIGMEALEDFERELSGKLLAANIAYYKYSL